MSGTLDHLHQYRRVSAKNRKQYMCVHPKCYHKLGKHLLLGKACICNNCGSEFILDTYALTLAEPKCTGCRYTRNEKDQEKRVQTLLSEHVRPEDLKKNLQSLGKLL